jgi:cadmium resistance protein CadD (predicted permease)
MLVSMILFTVVVLILAFIANRYFIAHQSPRSPTAERYAYAALVLVWIVALFFTYRAYH